MGRPPIGKVAMTGAERTRLYRRRLGPVTKPVTKPAGPSHDALVQELVEARAEIGLLRQRIQDLEKALGNKPKPKSEPKPSLDPGSEAARQIKALKTRVRNLQDQLAMERNTFLKLGRMDFATRSLIAKVLHPEATLSDKVRDDAYKAFTAWTADSKVAGRR